ncbi:helix-turn-helix domain-containing protein [Streptomyces sp. NPDC090025]|uniref:helix-turn-helix domain-containing protein n=1 Tax=Streptomyces sp. NPDC090025 TaxID=3365922 RepID=UPI003836B280
MTTRAETAPDPGEARDPAEFVVRLQRLKNWSGLTYRELAARAAALGEVLPRSTVATMLTRPTLPRPELLAVFVRACGLGPERAADWEAVRGRLAARGGAVAEREAGAVAWQQEDAPDPGGAEPDGAEPDGAESGGTGPGGAEPDRPGPDGAGPGDPAVGPSPTVWPRAVAPGTGGPEDPDPAGRPAGPGSGGGARTRLHRALVGAVGVTALVLATVSVVAYVRDDTPPAGRARPPHLTAPAEGPVRIRVVGPGLCLGERPGSRSGQVLQRSCAVADLPRYTLRRLPGDQWRIDTEHPDFGPGCSGVPSGGRIPDAALEDSECGDATRIERFTLVPYGSPVTGYRIAPAGSATGPLGPERCVTVTGDRAAAWTPLALAPCAADAAGQLFSFDRR